MSQLTEAVFTILSLVVGVAILSVLVSPRSQTAAVIGAGSSGFANVLSAATAPVTGATTAPNVGGGFNAGSFGLSNFQLPL
jgi:hypothetical protein